MWPWCQRQGWRDPDAIYRCPSVPSQKEAREWKWASFFKDYECISEVERNEWRVFDILQENVWRSYDSKVHAWTTEFFNRLTKVTTNMSCLVLISYKKNSITEILEIKKNVTSLNIIFYYVIKMIFFYHVQLLFILRVYAHIHVNFK